MQANLQWEKTQSKACAVIMSRDYKILLSRRLFLDSSLGIKCEELKILCMKSLPKQSSDFPRTDFPVSDECL